MSKYSAKGRAPIHVCSLSMSALGNIKKEMRDVDQKYRSLPPQERARDVTLNLTVNRLRWANLALEYNRFTQLQFVYNHLGDKGSSPEMRQVKMRPLFKAWKREVLRQKWQEVREALDSAGIERRFARKKMGFDSQRAELAGRSLSGLKFNI